MARPRSSSRSMSIESERKKKKGGERSKGGSEVLMEISSKEAALIVGKGGSTKKKVESAADVRLEVDTNPNSPDKSFVRITTKDARKKLLAKDYISLLLENKQEIKSEQHYVNIHAGRDDLTTLRVPQSTVGYITGKARATLHSLEEDTKTLMFFDTKDANKAEEVLMIFSVHARGRKQAELKIMSAIESKLPGHFLSGDFKAKFEKPSSDGSLVGMTVEKMDETQFTYALGRGGSTRRKIERASGAVIEYVGYNAFIAGTDRERRRGLDYLRMLLMQKDGKDMGEFFKADRDDLTIGQVPRDYVAAVSGAKGTGLRKVEERTDTFCFFETKKEGGDRAYQKLYILGESKREREIAESMFLKAVRRQEDRKRRDDRRDRDRGRDRERGRDRDRDRKRDRDDDRDRRRDRKSDRRRRSRSSSESSRSYSSSDSESMSPVRGRRRERSRSAGRRTQRR